MPRALDEDEEEEAQGLLPTTASGPLLPASTSKSKSSSVSVVFAVLGIGAVLAGLYGLSGMFKMGKAHAQPRTFSVVDGFFKQSQWADGDDLPSVYNEDFQFGIVDADWNAFEERVDALVKNAGPDESYKVLFNARHGEGFHNVKEAQVGTPLWDCKWSLLETDGVLRWGPDPSLTELGEQQARTARDAWTTQLARGAPMPQVFLSSPLTRSASTCNITWSDKSIPSRPQIWEVLREMIGLHTCDKRGQRAYIEKAFPNFDVEPSLTEGDELWTKDLQEPQVGQNFRMHLALERLFADYPNATYVYTSTHSGSIHGIMDAVSHIQVPIMTGGMLPVVVKAVPAPFPLHPPKDAWNGPPPCPPDVNGREL